MTGLPFEAEAVNAIVADPFPGVADPMPGAPGGPAGVTVVELEAGPVPTALVAVTEQVYIVPLVSPVTTIGAVAPDAVTGPGRQLTP